VVYGRCICGRRPRARYVSLLAASPPASPAFVPEAGKQKTGPTDPSQQLICLKKFGAGEGIRTLDPDLGMVEGGKTGHAARVCKCPRHSRVLTDVPALIEGMASGSQSPKPKTPPS